MTLAWISEDEWYPCLSATQTEGYGATRVEVAPERYESWRRAQDEWDAAQEDMKEAIKNDRATD